MDPSTLKILQGAAGAAGASTIGVEDVFSTDLWLGTGNSMTITNGIDLAGEGGLVWTKARNINDSHTLIDSTRKTGTYYDDISSSATSVSQTSRNWGISSLNNNGYTLGGSSNQFNYSGGTHASWTFRKQEKFFDIVTYTGNGSNRTIAHSLGSIPGMILIKQTDGTESWRVYHQSIGAGKFLYLNGTNAEGTSSAYWNDTEPTASVFSVGTHDAVNQNTKTYVAYLFAHEEAEFGPNSDQKIISCGSYTGNGSNTGPEINLGFEPQWIMLKRASGGTGHWRMWDSMRGITTGGNDPTLYPNSNSAEYSNEKIELTSTGFKIKGGDAGYNSNGDTIIYIAIAAETGKTMKAIETGSDVFAMDAGAGTTTTPNFDSAFPVDFGLVKHKTSAENWYVSSRLTSKKFLYTSNLGSEGALASANFDSNVGWSKEGSWNSNYQSWMWKRHAGFDVVAYTGNGSAGHQVPHSLSKSPEMIWIKKRAAVENWAAGHKGLNGGTNPWNYTLYLNTTTAETQSSAYFNNTAPTSTHFTLGASSEVNFNNEPYLAMLFASVDGVSKVGYYDGSASELTITTGFQPRFVIIRRVNEAQDWCVFDTTRGWASGVDQRIELNDDDAQNNSYDWGAPTSTGFTLTPSSVSLSGKTNYAGGKYIYYAHA